MMRIATHVYLNLERALTAVAGTALVLMMLVVVADIVGRSSGLWYILSTPEQTTLYMMLLGFLGLARSFRMQDSIVVDVATHNLPKRLVRRIDAVWAIATAAVLVPLGWFVLQNGLVLDSYGQRSEALGLSPLVNYGIASFGLVAAGLVSLLVGLRRLISAEDEFPEPDSIQQFPE